jgi:hypothetical protein
MYFGLQLPSLTHHLRKTIGRRAETGRIPPEQTGDQPLGAQGLPTERQIAANRVNAKKSTGPKTPAGNHPQCLSSRIVLPSCLGSSKRAQDGLHRPTSEGIEELILRLTLAVSCLPKRTQLGIKADAPCRKDRNKNEAYGGGPQESLLSAAIKR